MSSSGPTRRLRMRGRAVVVFAVVITAALNTLCSPAQAATPPELVMWVWDQPDPQALVAAAEARGVTEIFLAVPPAIAKSSSTVKNPRANGAPAAVVPLKMHDGQCPFETDSSAF